MFEIDHTDGIGVRYRGYGTSQVAGKVVAVPVDQMDPEPLWSQLAAILRKQIKSGELAPGALLPSESYLQEEHGVGRSTVRHALQVLRDEGLVITITARGTFVK